MSRHVTLWQQPWHFGSRLKTRQNWTKRTFFYFTGLLNKYDVNINAGFKPHTCNFTLQAFLHQEWHAARSVNKILCCNVSEPLLMPKKKKSTEDFFFADLILDNPTSTTDKLCFLSAFSAQPIRGRENADWSLWAFYSSWPSGRI